MRYMTASELMNAIQIAMLAIALRIRLSVSTVAALRMTSLDEAARVSPRFTASLNFEDTMMHVTT